MRPNEKCTVQFCTTVYVQKEPLEVLCDEVETVKGFSYLGD